MTPKYLPITLCVLVMTSLTLATVAMPAEAQATGTVCAKITHSNDVNPSHRTQFRLSTDALAPGADCPSQSSAVTLLEGECIDFNIGWRRDGATAPADPAFWLAYWLRGGAADDHGADGEQNWPTFNQGGTATYAIAWRYITPPSGTAQFCATRSGVPDDTPWPGTYRLVLRMCEAGNEDDHCDQTTTGYDINSDTNPTCACYGDPGVGYSANGNPGSLLAIHNQEIRDPLYLDIEERVILVGAQVNVSVHARFLNGTMRPDAEANITMHVKAPDHTWVADGANPTNMRLPSDVGQVYHYTFTASQAGTYTIVARSISSTNEIRLSAPLRIVAKPLADLPPTRGFLDYFLSRLNATADDQRGATQYHTNAATNGTGVLVKDKTGFELSNGERALANTSRENINLNTNTTAADNSAILDARTAAREARDAARYGNDEARNKTGVKVSDKAGYTLSTSEHGLIGNASWTNTTPRTLTGVSNLSSPIAAEVWGYVNRSLTYSGGVELSDAERALFNASIREPLAANGNATRNSTDAARTEIAILRADVDRAATVIQATIRDEENASRELQPGYYVASAWGHIAPAGRDHALLLIGAVGLTGYAVWGRGRERMRHRRKILAAGLLVLALYVTVIVAPTAPADLADRAAASLASMST